MVSKNANITNMVYTVEYFHVRVKNEIESWPDGILADYARREGIGRALYCYVDGHRIVILHAFVKKTQETPEKELNLARKRLKEVRNG